MRILSSARGILEMLKEDHHELKIYALKNLNSVVDLFWMEIADSIPIIKSLFEDEAFEERELASLILSKVYLHLNDFDKSLEYALSADAWFDISEGSDYVNVIIAKALDEYIALKLEKDSRWAKLEALAEMVLCKGIVDGDCHQALGIALKWMPTTILESILSESTDISSALLSCIKLSDSVIDNRERRCNVLKALVRLCESLFAPPSNAICEWLMFLDEPEAVAGILSEKLSGGQVKPSKKKVKDEPGFEILKNPTRVLRCQEKFITFLRDSRYAPVKLAQSGFVLLKDLQPEKPEVYSLTDPPCVQPSQAGGAGAAALEKGLASSAMSVDEEPQAPEPLEKGSASSAMSVDEEPQAPEPFEYV